MSHRATTWAIEQRGLNPGPKLLLLLLADRHNKDTRRCDPSQERLAHDAGMSRASVNRNLKKLEDAGLIRRVKRVDTRTKKQMSTFYHLGCDYGFPVSQIETATVSQKGANPCLTSDEHSVSDCDTNSVRETQKQPTRNCSGNSDSFEEFWNIYPNSRNRDATRKAFEDTVKGGVDAHDIIAGAKQYREEQKGKERRYIKYSDNWLKNKGWAELSETSNANARGDCIQGTVLMYAEKINSKKYVPLQSISPAVVRVMVNQGLVSLKTLRSLGVQV